MKHGTGSLADSFQKTTQKPESLNKKLIAVSA